MIFKGSQFHEEKFGKNGFKKNVKFSTFKELEQLYFRWSNDVRGSNMSLNGRNSEIIPKLIIH